MLEIEPPEPAIVRGAAIGQGVFYLVTGIWPLVSIGSFQAVTGPKTDLWLVKTVGVLITVVGGVLTMAGIRRQVTAEVQALAIGSAMVFAAIDTVYVARRRISPIYLLDAVAEICLTVLWLFIGIRRRSTRSLHESMQ